MTTKEKILYEALEMFSYKGYDSVSIRDISKAVEIKESSIYYHFKSKQEILETIINETLKRYVNVLNNLKIPSVGIDNVSDFYDKQSEDEFLDICCNIFLFYLNDEYISKLRRLLTIEQYNNIKIGQIFVEFFIERVIERQREVLQEFIDSERFIDGDAYTMALQFYSPVFLLLYKYDKIENGEEKALKELKLHAKQFNAIYLNKNKAEHKI